MWLALAGIVGYAVIPQLGGAQRSLELLRSVDPALIGLAVALQVAAILSQAALTRSVISGARRPGFGDVTRIELASTAVSHTVPGGTAAGTALAYRLLTDAGVSGAGAGFAVATRGLGSALVLNVLLWLALVLSIPTFGFHPWYTTAAVLGVVLLGTFGGLVVLLTRHQARAKRALHSAVKHLPLLDEERAPEVVEGLAERLRAVASDRGVILRVVAWSAAYWLGSAASLWVFLAAFGHRPGLVPLLVAFGLANVLAVIPVTPRGLGVVEATLIPLLIGFGGPSSPVTFGVLAWRLVSFWLPIPAGGLAYLSLRVVPGAADNERRRSRRRRWAEKLADLSREAGEDAESFGQWARERGIGRRR